VGIVVRKPFRLSILMIEAVNNIKHEQALPPISTALTDWQPVAGLDETALPGCGDRVGVSRRRRGYRQAASTLTRSPDEPI